MKKVPITQSREWQKLQDDLGEKSFFEENANFQYLAIKKSTPAGKYLYCPYGPVAETATDFKKSLKSLEELAKKEDAIFIRIEPQDPDFAKNLPKTAKKSHDLNPKETWVLDLTGTDDDLKAKLPSRLLRYYKNREKQGITIETSHNPDDIKHLLTLQKALAREKGISTFSENYLKTELSQPFATLYLVRTVRESENVLSRGISDNGSFRSEEPRNDGRDEASRERSISLSNVIAAGLVFDDGKTRYNLQGAQSDEGRKLHATGILTIQLILDAKAKNLETFDFWGIAPKNAPKNHPWAGFTGFKKTFAGYEKDYAGTYDLVENPLKYRFYQLMRKVRRLV